MKNDGGNERSSDSETAKEMTRQGSRPEFPQKSMFP